MPSKLGKWGQLLLEAKIMGCQTVVQILFFFQNSDKTIRILQRPSQFYLSENYTIFGIIFIIFHIDIEGGDYLQVTLPQGA